MFGLNMKSLYRHKLMYTVLNEVTVQNAYCTSLKSRSVYKLMQITVLKWNHCINTSDGLEWSTDAVQYAYYTA